MNNYGKFFVDFLTPFFEGLISIFKSFFAGIFEMFNIIKYLEVIEKYKELGCDYSHVCCLYSTAPFVTSESLKQAFSKLIEGNRDCIFPAVAFSYPIQRSLIESTDGKAVMKWPEFRYSRSQDLEPFYHDAGQFYFYTKKYLEEGNGLGEGNCEMLILSELEVQDLDTIVDWKLAEMKYKIIHNED